MIKGNINDRGQRIYHMPGDKFYGRTNISAAKGERWFCSEAEATALDGNVRADNLRD